MKITKQYLAQIIKEEVEEVVDEIEMQEDYYDEELEEASRCKGPTKKTSSTRKGKKYMKCIKNPKGKGYVRRHWGEKGARVSPKGSKRNKRFRKRHNCKSAKAGSPNALSCADW